LPQSTYEARNTLARVLGVLFTISLGKRVPQHQLDL